MEEFIKRVQPILLRYCRKKWGCLRISPEDLVQETMIYIFQKWERIKNHPNPEGHCCRAAHYLGLNELLREHKAGLFIARSANDGYDLYECYNDEVTHMFDPWLEEYRKKRRAYDAEYYKRNKERINARNTDYYRRNRDAVNAYHRAYYRKHKDEMREKTREYQRNYYERHKEEIKAKREAKKAIQKNKEGCHGTD